MDSYMEDDEKKKQETLQAYLASKYGSMGLGDDKRTELEGKIEKLAPAGWRKGLVAAGASLGGGDPGSAVRGLYAEQDQARSDLKEFDNRRSKALGEIDDERKFKTAQMEDDPNSEASKTAQALAKKMMPQGKFEGMSASKLKNLLPSMEKMYTVEQSRLARSDAANASADLRRQAADEKRDDKLNRQKEVDMQKLSKDVAGTQALTNALDEVEAELGFKLEGAEAKNGKVKIGGKEADLPGVNIPGIGRTTFYSEKARNLQSAADRVFNATLKDRSGAAVTNPELERLKREFNEGKFNTEAEMVSALQRYKRGVVTEMKNREAAYNPEVVETYTDQGGRTSRTLDSAPSQPATKVVGGVTYRKVPGGWEEVENAEVSLK